MDQNLVNHLKQLKPDQLRRILTYKKEYLTNGVFYKEGVFNYFAIGLSLDKTMNQPSHERIFGYLKLLGYSTLNIKTTKEELDLTIKSLL